jgi:anti-sigma regulatory factor (Ser/Thr protein kinase)
LRRSRGWNAGRVIIENVAVSPRDHAVTWEYRLSSNASSIGQARRHVGYALEPYVDAEMVERAQLVVSELVTNAVRHGPGELITLRLVCGVDGRVSGEVADQGIGAVVKREQGPNAVGGLGLPIVAALANEWGVHPGSTRVWFRFDPV